MTRDPAGNIYATAGGGKNWAGVVFKLAPDGSETVLHSINMYTDGEYPHGLLRDGEGNLYGTTQRCGLRCDMTQCCGAVFKLAPDGTETVLHLFAGGDDGSWPESGVIRDKAGNLYGTTAYGGTGSGRGTVFKVAPDGTETVLHSFAGGSDGQQPQARLIVDSAGNLYGTTTIGGDAGCEGQGAGGCGTVFKLAPDGTETVLYAFRGGSDGAFPSGGLVRDKSGNLYGATAAGGGGSAYGCQLNFEPGCGTVYKLTPDGIETVLYAFGTQQGDGLVPSGGLMKGADGKLYGTTAYGGSEAGCNGYGCGTVFRLNK